MPTRYGDASVSRRRSGSLTIGGSGNVILASSLSGLGSTSVVKFHWSSLGLYEESRVVL
jgi:hypothetical protein